MSGPEIRGGTVTVVFPGVVREEIRFDDGDFDADLRNYRVWLFGWMPCVAKFRFDASESRWSLDSQRAFDCLVVGFSIVAIGYALFEVAGRLLRGRRNE